MKRRLCITGMREINDVTQAEDLVNHPNHYNFGRVETIDYIEDCLGIDGIISYCLGNVIKYVSRARYKGKFVEDIKKARWYLDHAIEAYEYGKFKVCCESLTENEDRNA